MWLGKPFDMIKTINITFHELGKRNLESCGSNTPIFFTQITILSSINALNASIINKRAIDLKSFFSFLNKESGSLNYFETSVMIKEQKIIFFGRYIAEKSVFGRRREEKTEEKSIK